MAVVVESVELARRDKVGDLERACLGAPPQHAEGILAAERAHRLDNLARGIDEGHLACDEHAMAEDIPLAIADDLARNERGKRLNDAFRKRLRAVSGRRDFDQRKRAPHLSSAERRHDGKIRRTSYWHKRNED